MSVRRDEKEMCEGEREEGSSARARKCERQMRERGRDKNSNQQRKRKTGGIKEMGEHMRCGLHYLSLHSGNKSLFV